MRFRRAIQPFRPCHWALHHVGEQAETSTVSPIARVASVADRALGEECNIAWLFVR
ncbi:MAG TPA: hypothetical protein VNN25_02090 [Thermoanaerobaculia bacterium]|nr:hypothetical protein [Thermoanaerobaculia bacterium]